MGNSVYVLEDDESISGLIKVSLEMHGIECMTFPDIKSFNSAISANVPDVVVLDIMLPDGNGLDVLRKIKKSYPSLPCLVLSALGQESERIKGLDSGADDYITKPFSALELAARVKAALRRQADEPLLTLGGLVLDLAGMTVTMDGQPLELNRKEFELLKYLLKNKGKVLTRDDILDKVWGYGSAETRTLDNHIARLRKLGISGIETVFGVGYRLKVTNNEG